MKSAPKIASILLLVVLAWIAALQENAWSGGKRPRPMIAQTEGDDEPTQPGGGLRFKLSEGTPENAQGAPAPPAQATPLSAAQIDAILKRLPALTATSGDRKPFALREHSLPPPRTGRTVPHAFPPPPVPDLPSTVANQPLQVVRHAPEGPVPQAPHLSVTFSQPMVPVTSHEDIAAAGVPVQLSPAPPGTWRWLGARTLLFAPKYRFPMATRYAVAVPAGTRSATGGSLAAAAAWTFTTPPPHVESFSPQDGPATLDPLLVATLDQDVDPAAVLATVTVRAGRERASLRLATPEELAKDPRTKRLLKGGAHEAKRWIAFRATSPFPTATEVTVEVGPGTPSAEGPLKTETAQSFSFQTYGPLKVTEHRCGYGDEPCPPFTPFQIRFSNPLDPAAFKTSMVHLEPALPGMKAWVSGETLTIEGPTRGRTTYRLTLDPALRDVFGQTLGSSSGLAFQVGSAEASLAASGDGFVVVDPAGTPSFSVYSINHPTLKVRAWAVGPQDWPAFNNFMRNYGDEKPPPAPGHRVLDTVVKVQAAPDELAESRVDLRPALKNGFGHVVLIVEPPVQPKERWRQQRVVAWVEATHIGLDAFVDPTDLYGWATALQDGAPLPGVTLQILTVNARNGSSTPATTGADGMARIPLPSGSESDGTSLLVARQGDDVAFLPRSTSWWGGGSWRQRPVGDALQWYVFDDRQMYRPSEEVHVKGWIRRIGGGKLGDVGALQGAASTVHYALLDSRGNQILKGDRKLNALGGFDLAFTLPPTMNLGSARLQLSAQGGDAAVSDRETSHSFQVQEFRRPEFEVSASTDDAVHMVGGSATVSVAAKYYAGGGLPNAEVTWRVTSTPGYYTPPGRDGYTFGTWVPWWERRPSGGDSHTETFKAATDGTGAQHLKLDFLAVDPPRPTSVSAEASVMDVNRQAWNASTGLLVHPSSLYVGIRSGRTFVQPGEPLKIDSIVTDVNGKAVPGRAVTLRAVRLDWNVQNGEWKQEEVDPQEIKLQSTAEPVHTEFRTKEGGTYRVTATAADDQGRRNLSDLTLWVAGGKVPPARDVSQQKVTLVPDRERYQPGDTAEVLVQSPFFPAEAVMSLRRNGVVETQRFRMTGSSYTLKVPIVEGYVPNVHLQVDVVGAAERAADNGEPDPSLPKRPAFAAGELNLSVPPLARTLQLKVAPEQKALEPGAETWVDVDLRTAAGQPVSGGEVAVVVVDESVLALTGYRLSDPIDTFYPDRGDGTSDYHLRSSVQLARPADLKPHAANGDTGRLRAMRKSAAPPPPMARPAPSPSMEAAYAPGGGAAAPPPIKMRTNLNALATFQAEVPTDASGHARVRVKLPDNLTRYRIMAVAVANGREFGAADATLTARLPLMVRPSAPRFLNFGDRLSLPIVVQNQTDAPMQVQVAARASNLHLDAAGYAVRVPANDRVEVRFPAAAEMAGTARFQVGAVAGSAADAAEVSLPVWTPATTEAFATYGELDDAATVQPVQAPSHVFPQFGGLEISTSSTSLQALTDALLYLQAYPFECSEQLSSRILAVAALRDVLTAFKAQGLPSPDAMNKAVARDLERLRGMQGYDGGFGFWKRGDEEWPFLSVHVANALARAHEKGYAVPADMLARSRSYLQAIESHIPSWYGASVRQTIIAYALNVRKRVGDADAARARQLIKQAGLEHLSMEAVGWILPVLSGDPASRTEVAAIRRLLENHVSEEAGTAHFVTGYGDGDYLLLHSSRRVDGIVLEALIGDQPKSDLIPKIVRGLLAHRVKGRWDNTQENAFVLLALDRYFNTYEKVTPDFVARVWLGDGFAGEQAFKGRSTERHVIDVPMEWLAKRAGVQNLVLGKQGKGRLYYRIGMQYAPTDLKLPPSDHGFTVLRRYEALDDPKDVRRDADGTWRVRAGARIRVKLQMVATSRRYHVALVDPLPAGLEAINPALAVSGSVPQDPSQREGFWWWWRTWYEHQNLRDERVEAFTSLLWDGVHDYSYVARATTPGSFVVPPPKAEEMYHPETFGRGAGDRLIVE